MRSLSSWPATSKASSLPSKCHECAATLAIPIGILTVPQRGLFKPHKHLIQTYTTNQSGDWLVITLISELSNASQSLISGMRSSRRHFDTFCNTWAICNTSLPHDALKSFSYLNSIYLVFVRALPPQADDGPLHQHVSAADPRPKDPWPRSEFHGVSRLSSPFQNEKPQRQHHSRMQCTIRVSLHVIIFHILCQSCSVQLVLCNGIQLNAVHSWLDCKNHQLKQNIDIITVEVRISDWEL